MIQLLLLLKHPDRHYRPEVEVTSALEAAIKHGSSSRHREQQITARISVTRSRVQQGFG
jgi:hypothetical protein